MSDRIIFTDHALEKLRQRRITKSLVLKTIKHCEKMVYEQGYYHVFRKWQHRYLKVIFKREGEIIIVITEYFIYRL